MGNLYAHKNEETEYMLKLLNDIGEGRPHDYGCTDTFMEVTVALSNLSVMGKELSDQYGAKKMSAMELMFKMIDNESHYRDMKACWLRVRPDRGV